MVKEKNLNKKGGDNIIEQYEQCQRCNGNGFVVYQSDEDEFNKDICEVCWGAGRIPARLKSEMVCLIHPNN
jgi:DnaJ-class molecular chaperone